MKLWLPLAVTVIFAATAFAQTAGTITGIVVDQSGGAIAGATVTLQQGNASANQPATMTDDEGVFTLRGMRNGHYVLRIEKPRFVRQDVAVDVPATSTPIRVVLGVAGVRESVDVAVAETGIELTLETRDEAHAHAIVELVRSAGYPVTRMH